MAKNKKWKKRIKKEHKLLRERLIQYERDLLEISKQNGRLLNLERELTKEEAKVSEQRLNERISKIRMLNENTFEILEQHAGAINTLGWIVRNKE